MLETTASFLHHLPFLLFLNKFLIVFGYLLLLSFLDDVDWELLVASFTELLWAALGFDPGHPAGSALCDNLLGLISW